MTAQPALSVVTVALAGHVPHVLANRQLQQQLSPGPVTWIVVDNDDGRVARALAHVTTDDLVVVPGVSARDIAPGFGFGSYHHAAGLAVGVRAARTRFLLVLDPDLYVVRRGWVKDVLATMADEDLAVFGVPWHPAWYAKYRHFPCVHCLFLDAARLPVNELDFTPELREQPTQRLSPAFAAGEPLRTATSRRQRASRLLTAVPRVAYHLTLMRRHIGRTRDTGYRIYTRWHGSCRAGIVQAVAPASDFSFPFHLRSAPGRALERILPERWSYVPRGYRSRQTFLETGALDGRRYGWEEFMWRDAPFAVHVRRTKQGGLSPRDDESIAAQVLAGFSDPQP